MVDLPNLAGPPVPLKRLRHGLAWLDMLFKDHGFLRALYWHHSWVDADLMRGSQPSPARLAWAKRMGFKTVLNLRGARPTCGSYILERKACHELGLTLVDFPIRSRAALERQTWLAACAIFDQLEYPVFMHCKAGADRTGLMAVLYLHIKRGVDLATARDQLSLRYGHIRQAKTGIIDYFYDQFTAEGAPRGQTLPEWIESSYDRVSLDRGFRENWLAKILVDKILHRE